jgi:S-adenosylmethionine:tRNA ribosyltransferase-isomerase
VHQAGESHFELLEAFADDEALNQIAALAMARGYRTHEFGDSMLIEHQARAPPQRGICRTCSA